MSIMCQIIFSTMLFRDPITPQACGHPTPLDEVFCLSPDGILIFDPQGHARYYNPAFVRLTGWADADLLGIDEATFIARLNARCTKGHHLESWAALDGAANADPASDKPAFIEIAAIPARSIELRLRNSSSAQAAKILYLRDVTAQAHLQAVKTDHLAKAAHELRSPIAGILGFSELLLQQQLSPEKTHEFLDIIHASSLRMAYIVNDVLDLARIESGAAHQVHQEALDLVQQLRFAIQSAPPPAGRTAPTVSVPGAGIPILADAHKVQQVLQNLLSNAYKYSAANSAVEVFFVAPHTGTPGERAGLAIRDHGIGMSPAHLEHVGEKFFRADKSGAVPGTGLGISIVKEIMAQLGGTLHIESELGVGTVVTVLFPLPAVLSGA